jgi:hypothetical protein
LGGLDTEKKFRRVVDSYFETTKTAHDLSTVVESGAPDATACARTIAALQALDRSFDEKVKLADGLTKGLGYVNATGLLARIPHVAVGLAASYALVAAYVIVAGSDYADGPHLDFVDRVVGVRRTVESELALASR